MNTRRTLRGRGRSSGRFCIWISFTYYHQRARRTRPTVSTKLHFFNFPEMLWKKDTINSFGCDRKNGFNVFALSLHFCVFVVPQSVRNSRWKSFELWLQESAQCVHEKTHVSDCGEKQWKLLRKHQKRWKTILDKPYWVILLLTKKLLYLAK